MTSCLELCPSSKTLSRTMVCLKKSEYLSCALWVGWGWGCGLAASWRKFMFEYIGMTQLCLGFFWVGCFLKKMSISYMYDHCSWLTFRGLVFVLMSSWLAGENVFLWFGPTPQVVIMEPEIIREVLSKSYIFQKPPSHPIAKFLVQGLLSYDTDKWAKHRKLINPAFHSEKLKVFLNFTSFNSNF